MTFTITLEWAWWYVPALVSLVTLVLCLWPRKNVFDGVFACFIALIFTALSWAIAGALK